MGRFRLSRQVPNTAPNPKVARGVIHLVVRAPILPVVSLLVPPQVRWRVGRRGLPEPQSPVLVVSRRIRPPLDSAESVASPSARSRSSGGNRGPLGEFASCAEPATQAVKSFLGGGASSFAL